MICPFCAETIVDDSQFCPLCGTKLTALPPGINASPGAPQPLVQQKTSGKAIASLICGIFFFFLPASIVAIIMGHLSLSEIRKSAGSLTGQGIAVAGLVLGYVGIAAIPFILIIAAIAIPNLVRARMAANEASAVGALRSYNFALVTYAAQCPKAGFPQSLENLGPGNGDCEHARLLDGTLGKASPMRSGYAFHYSPGPPDNLGQVTSFTLTAEPVTSGTTGQKCFFTDQTGVIRFSASGAADTESPPL